MSVPSSTELQTPEAAAVASAAGRTSPADIDASCRWPLLLLFLSGVIWLLVGTGLALIATIKLHKADFLADCAWLTLGRIRPAAMNAFLYGFALQVGIGVMLWLLSRLGGVRLAFQFPVVIATKFWNIGVLVGLWAILAGGSTGFEWLEMPRYASAILFVSYLVIGLCAVATFQMRRERDLYVSQWYLLAAIFWFPWIYSAANYLLVLSPVRSTFQSAVNAWYGGNLLGLWLAPIALAGIYYFLPKLTGQPLYSRQLAIFAFWTMAIFTNWSGLTSLIGGPVPRWMGSVSTVANVCLLVPLAANALNWHLTNAGNPDAWKKSLELRFVLFGAVCYFVNGLVSMAMSLPPVSAVTSFTYAVVARNYLAIHGFVGMTLFGCLYYIIPRLVQLPWANARLIKVHFGLSAAGVAVIFIALTFGGISQGWKLADPNIPFPTVVKGTIPFVGLSTLGLLLLFVGQIAFLVNFARVLRTFCEPICRSICAELCGGVATAKAGVKS